MFSLITLLTLLPLAVFGQFGNSFQQIEQAATLVTLQEQQPLSTSTASVQQVNGSPRCGEAFNANNTGGIFYKAFARVEDNERCAWIIGVPGAVGYNINLHLLVPPTNQPGSRQRLIITGIRHGGPTGLEAPVFTSYLPTSYGRIAVNDAHIVLVTFYSETLNNVPGTGFILQHEPIYSGSIAPTSTESHHRVWESPAILKHPPSGAYFDLELSAYLFPPPGNIFAGRTNHILYQLQHMHANCHDSLFVYNLNLNTPNNTGIWQQTRRICSNVTSLYIPSDDMVLVLFQTDQIHRGSGFRLSGVSC